MTTPRFITRLNWRLILLHFVACWCSAYAFNLFSYLHDLEFIRLFMHYMDTKDRSILAQELVGGRLTFFVLWLGLSKIAGQLVAFTISLIISLKKHWFWLNSLIALFISGLLIGLHIDGWRWLKQIFLEPGDLFGYPNAGYFILNGSILLILGLLCLFLPAAVRFAEARKTTTQEIQALSD